MWQYNHTPDPDELMHYGVRGMKWKKRKKPSWRKEASKDLDRLGLSVYRALDNRAPARYFRNTYAREAAKAITSGKETLPAKAKVKVASGVSKAGWQGAKARYKIEKAIRKSQKKRSKKKK